MRFLPSVPHAILDYLYGLLLIFMPTLLHLESHSNDTLLFTIGGCAVIVMSAFTDYELSLSRSIPFRVHLLFDFLTGLLLIVLPLLLQFDNPPKAAFIGLGIVPVITSFVTKINPSHEKA